MRTKLESVILRCYLEDMNIVNDRTALLAEVWRRYGWSDARSLEENLKRVPSAESVSRRLRDLHERGKVVYSEKELDRRTEAFKAERDSHSSIIRNWRG